MRPPRRASRSSHPRDPRADEPYPPAPSAPLGGYGAPDQFDPPAGPRPLEHERHRPYEAIPPLGASQAAQPFQGAHRAQDAPVHAQGAHGPGYGDQQPYPPAHGDQNYVPEAGDTLAYSPTGRAPHEPPPGYGGGHGGPHGGGRSGGSGGGRDFWDSRPGGGGGRKRRTPLIIAGAAGAMALVVGAGIAVNQLTSDGGEQKPTAASKPEGGPSDQTGTQPDASPSDSPSRTPSRAPSTKPKAKPSSKKPASKPTSGKTGGGSDSPSGGSGGNGGSGGSGGGSGSGGNGGSGSGGGGGATASEMAVYKLTNQQRAKAGCSPLRLDARLTRAARLHSQDMAAHDYFSHDSRNGDDPWTRIKRQGYTQPGAENIAKGFPDAAAVMKGWMNSPGHRANILNCGLKAIGVGRADGPDGPLWTQDFGWM
ncbi:CAP domain-containing protein [Actinomadura rupiterrae]|uniref:CAP domain-containing protein n=1 Tax=Actinomadura rupiterrae TaxID=559627 RepID=UPI0020A235B1|nr:CAP domain-containing protein [Actinomadura rupiterrae]MCP2343296.1 uncharacterized protein YkwD [Actinomadura rupiterrae]